MMALSRALACLAVVALLTACSRGGGVKPPAPGPDTPDRPGTVTEGPNQPAGPVQAANPRPVPAVLARPVEGALQRVTFKSGQVVGAEGVYFLNASTGAGEGWIQPGNGSFRSRDFSEDARFVIAGALGNGYVIDRQSGTVWQWDPERVQARLAGAGGFLFAEVDADGGPETGRYFWAGLDFKPKHIFTVGDGGGWGTSVLLSPDGSRVAMMRPGGREAQPQIALVTIASGEVQRLATPPVDYVGSARLEQDGRGFRVEIWAGKGNDQLRTWHFAGRRFDWEGKPLGDIQIPGDHVFFSPDGKWVAWEAQPVGTLAPATVIADAATLKPRVQALGVATCFQSVGSGGTRWLSDSSGLVVDTAGGYRILTLNGDLQQRQAFGGLTWKGEPLPAPDNPDRFAIGRTAIANGSGAQAVGVTLANFVTPVSMSPWGANGEELRFALPPKPGGGACSDHAAMPVRVQFPVETLPDFPLVVRGTGSCLRLRDRPHSNGNVVTCLADGTRLMAVRQRDDMPETTWLDDAWWLSAKTEKGETGWVSLKDQYVTWATP